MLNNSIDSSSFEETCFGSVVPHQNNVTVDFLGSVLYDIRRATLPISPPSPLFGRMDPALQVVITTVSTMVSRAEETVSTELQAKFSSKHLSVSAKEQDRKYLVDGHLPDDEAKRHCIHCGLPTVDEPDRIKASVTFNLITMSLFSYYSIFPSSKYVILFPIILFSSLK